ncbi:MAG: 4Fe-4S dicluster domain-containing protein [Rhodobacteraceae bacterium]|nr:4Fe-4S dicluster domain-containing protein [Paracoccaceae bacterium]
MTKWTIVADLNRCVGCQTCTAACKQTNATAPGVQWRKVLDFEAGEYPDVRRAFVPVGCMHCDEPPCLDVCPSTATLKRADGIVTIDYDICIGCAYCAVACPYQARFRVDTPNQAFGKDSQKMRHEIVRERPERRSVAQKCTLCVDKIDEGLANGLIPGIDANATPACVESCIAAALVFGDADDPDSNVSTLIAENRTFGMHEELGTGPNIRYLYSGKDFPEGSTATLVPNPIGQASVAPRHQHQWDWRAASNFVFGGAGTGLFTFAAVAGLFSPFLWWAGLLALAMVGLGLFCVWLEIGRPWRFLNVFRHPARSWMTREALAAMPYFGLGALAVLLTMPWPGFGAGGWVGLPAAAFALMFLYSQARILKAAKGIPVWRQEQIVPLIVTTGLTEGMGLFAVAALIAGTSASWISLTMAALAGLRWLAWRSYRGALAAEGAPTQSLIKLDAGPLNLSAPGQAAIVALALAGLVLPGVTALAGLLAVATGWAFKFTLITRAAYNQGYAIEAMPARGAGKPAPGVKPGWTRA